MIYDAGVDHHHHPGEGSKPRLECRKPCVKSVQPIKRVVCAELKLFTGMSSSSGMIGGIPDLPGTPLWWCSRWPV